MIRQSKVATLSFEKFDVGQKLSISNPIPIQLVELCPE